MEARKENRIILFLSQSVLSCPSSSTGYVESPYSIAFLCDFCSTFFASSFFLLLSYVIFCTQCNVHVLLHTFFLCMLAACPFFGAPLWQELKKEMLPFDAPSIVVIVRRIFHPLFCPFNSLETGFAFLLLLQCVIKSNQVLCFLLELFHTIACFLQ